MTLAQLFKKIFGPVEREAGIVAAHIEADAHSAVHFIEKEIEMIPQPIQDLINEISAVFSSHSNDAATITGLRSQLADCEAQCTAKDGQIAALTQQVSDLNVEVADIQTALAAAVASAPTPAPAPVDAPADGSASGDLTA